MMERFEGYYREYESRSIARNADDNPTASATSSSTSHVASRPMAFSHHDPNVLVAQSTSYSVAPNVSTLPSIPYTDLRTQVVSSSPQSTTLLPMQISSTVIAPGAQPPSVSMPMSPAPTPSEPMVFAECETRAPNIPAPVTESVTAGPVPLAILSTSCSVPQNVLAPLFETCPEECAQTISCLQSTTFILMPDPSTVIASGARPPTVAIPPPAPLYSRVDAPSFSSDLSLGAPTLVRDQSLSVLTNVCDPSLDAPTLVCDPSLDATILVRDSSLDVPTLVGDSSLEAPTLVRDLSLEARLSFLICRSMLRCPHVNRRAPHHLLCVFRRPLCVMLGDLRTLSLSSTPFDKSLTSEPNLLVLKKIGRRLHRGLHRRRSHRRKYEVKLQSVCSVVERSGELQCALA